MSMTAPCPDPGTSPSNVWYREYEVALLIGLVVGAYFLRVGAVPIQGEEPTRAQIAFEMVESGDWIVPHQQGIPFLTLSAAAKLAHRRQLPGVPDVGRLGGPFSFAAGHAADDAVDLWICSH